MIYQYDFFELEILIVASLGASSLHFLELFFPIAVIFISFLCLLVQSTCLLEILCILEVLGHNDFLGEGLFHIAQVLISQDEPLHRVAPRMQALRPTRKSNV